MATYLYDSDAEPLLRALLTDRGFEVGSAPHAHFLAKSPGCSVTFYRSGKLLIQGKESAIWDELLAPGAVLGGGGEDRYASALEKHPENDVTRWIGSDESGKGDYFGPLVTCAACIERDCLDLLAELGVTDSKQVADTKVHELAPGLKELATYSLVVLRPERYNDLYDRLGRNLNKLLAWSHARAIENVLADVEGVTLAVVDKFGPAQRLERVLMEGGRKLHIVQRTKAEDDPAVAVASLLARNEFLWQLRGLQKRFGQPFPKGAGGPVLAAGRRFVKTQGADQLVHVAKLHFKTTQSIGGAT